MSMICPHNSRCDVGQEPTTQKGGECYKEAYVYGNRVILCLSSSGISKLFHKSRPSFDSVFERSGDYV